MVTHLQFDDSWRLECESVNYEYDLNYLNGYILHIKRIAPVPQIDELGTYIGISDQGTTLCLLVSPTGGDHIIRKVL